jgi:DNA modification methylase
MNEPFRLYQGDCLERLKELPDNSIDSIVTDPPYGLSKQPDMIEVLTNWLNGEDYKHNSKGFMGKEWDSFVPGPAVWRECLRVLKPGGHIVAFYGTRTYDLGVLAMRIAGFEIRDQLAWAYGSGFPKSLDISKAIDATVATGKSSSKALSQTEKNRPIIGEVTRVVSKNRLASEGYSDSGVKRNRERFIDTESKSIPVTSSLSDSAKQWEGWGTALKPAFEPIVLARKPIEGTVAQNVMKHGVGGINIDGCRVHTRDNLNGGAYSVGGNRSTLAGDDRNAKGAGMFAAGKTANDDYNQPNGRFPANFMHDGSDEVVSLFPYSKSTGGDGYKNSMFAGGKKTGGHGLGDEGSAARFFYCPKASSKDRDDGLDEFESKRSGSMSATLNGTMLTGSGNERITTRKNIHPTVKPTELMQYLCRLITPVGGTILDPFMGSGSTGKAAMYEGFNFIGIELMQEHMEIAEARIRHALQDSLNSTTEVKKPKREKIEEKQENDVDITQFFG